MTKRKTSTRRTAIAAALFAAAALCASATTARADTIVFDNGFGPGTQQDWVLGMDFNVLGAIEVTQLGAFDSGGDGFSGSGITVGVFDLSTNTLVQQTTLTGTPGPLFGGSRFVPVSPFVLAPGSYSIVATGFTGANFNGNTGVFPFGVTSFNSINGRLALVSGGGRWAAGNSFGLPTKPSSYSQGDPVFQAGTFQANPVPDGGSAAVLLGLGLLGVGWARFRFKQ